ncbi:MAG: cysteine synthase A [Clostridia bacterium]|nr:cysteine synthase A [Clostridia bacterium]
MAKIYTSAEELIGRTPLLELKNIEKKFETKAKIIAKLEMFNPGGSAKDRVALSMLDDAEKNGKVNKDTLIIEPTSGNTGIGLALIAACRGYKAVIVMPDNMSEERKKIMGAYGAALVLTDGKDGMAGAIRKAEELAQEHPNSFIPSQFENEANADAHYRTTGPEIYKDTDGKVDIFVCGVGTGGTITGVGRYLKEKNKNVKVVAVEPFTSAVLSGEEKGAHSLQGIGAGFVPKVLDTTVYDEIIKVKDEEAFEMGREICRTEGLLVGISAGAALSAAVEVAKREENRGKNIVVLLPDTGDRYLSTKMFEI